MTYFFDGGREQRHTGEDWELVASRRDVPTYDHAPEMAAAGVARCFAERLGDGYAFAVVNLANPDMVGHTGVLPAVIAGVEASDAALGVILAAVEQAGGVALVTADHGNAEQMLEPDGSPHTAHTTNPVPLVVTVAGAPLREGGKLGDLAPTVLALLGVSAPLEMTGENLLASRLAPRGAGEPGVLRERDFALFFWAQAVSRARRRPLPDRPGLRGARAGRLADRSRPRSGRRASCRRRCSCWSAVSGPTGCRGARS